MDLNVNVDENTEIGNVAGKTSHFKKDPEINVLSKEEFEDRVTKVFHLLWKTLSKSFGPYGAPTIIYNYPWSHITKDGYTIMKNLSMNTIETKVDEAIKGMAADICGRLNYSVGDGTTTAIIATNSIYSNYIKNRDYLNSKWILPRNVIHKYEELKDIIIEQLSDKVKMINSKDPDELRQNIYDVVYISSNGDEIYSNYIADLYKELMSPSVICRLAPDGITKKIIVKGYKYNLMLNDTLYINNDNKTMDVRDADVIIFGTKITNDIYQKILKPLNRESRTRGRQLIVAAPLYDENMLDQYIKPDFNNEYKKTHRLNMILTTYRAINGNSKKLVNDFSVLMNTTVIDRAQAENMVNSIDAGDSIFNLFNIDGRNINGLRCVAIDTDKVIETTHGLCYNKGVDELPPEYKSFADAIDLNDNYVDLGYIRSCTLGLKESIFTDMVYDEKKYEVIRKDAETKLEEAENKYKKLGTFNVEVSQAQERYYALNLKMGIIEVGADSELSQNMTKDAVDDSIKAASSAYKYGVINGCNLDLIRIIYNLYNNENDETDKVLINILLDGFIDVYKTVLSNAFNDTIIDEEHKLSDDELMTKIENLLNKPGIFEDKDALHEAANRCYEKYGNISAHSLLIFYSIVTGKVLDVSTFTYSNKIINSVQTDEEVLKATIDLISLLIVGNQMVITAKPY